MTDEGTYDLELKSRLAHMEFPNGTSLSVWKDGTAVMFTQKDGHLDGSFEDGMFVESLFDEDCKYWPDGTPAN